MNILLLGQHGSGKSTQADLLSKELGLPVVSSGDIFRHLREEDTPLGRHVKDFYEHGEYIPDEETIPIVEARLQQPDVANGFILEGYPRTLNQAQQIKEQFDFVFHLAVPDEESVTRMLARGRKDDTEAAMRRRLEQHNAAAADVLEYYKSKGMLQDIDAHRPIEPIFQDLLSHIRA